MGAGAFKYGGVDPPWGPARQPSEELNSTTFEGLLTGAQDLNMHSSRMESPETVNPMDLVQGYPADVPEEWITSPPPLSDDDSSSLSALPSEVTLSPQPPESADIDVRIRREPTTHSPLDGGAVDPEAKPSLEV